MLPCTLFQKKKKKIVKQKLIWVVSLSRFKHIFILRFVIVHKKNKQRKKKKTERGALFAFGTIHFTNAVDTFSPSVSTAWRKYTEEVVSQAIDTWTQKPPRGVNVLLVPDFAHLFLFFFAMTSLLFTQKVLKTLYYDWLKFPSEFPLCGSAEVECLSIDGKSGDLSQRTGAEEMGQKGWRKSWGTP